MSMVGNTRPDSGLKAARRFIVDTLLMRADARPETAVAVGGGVVGLLLAAVLFGAFSSGGVQGPIDFERAAPGRGADRSAPAAFLDVTDRPSPLALQPLLSAMNTGRDFAAADDLFSDPEARTWLDHNLCAVSARRTSEERQALVYYLRNEADLCTGVGKAMMLAPMAPALTPIGAAILSLAILGAFTLWVWKNALFLRRVRRAYRRLYVSEHRADHLEAEG
jgi:hypothetical protein